MGTTRAEAGFFAATGVRYPIAGLIVLLHQIAVSHTQARPALTGYFRLCPLIKPVSLIERAQLAHCEDTPVSMH